MSIATLLPDGKIELPEEIRNFLHLQVGSQLSFTITQDQVVVQAVRLPVQSLKGMLKRPDAKTVSIEEMNEAITQEASV
jgi:bifunctional DNA-binding transcriptional regulator/antitoxin component of YhaV-PrlF toxin-antitoxin module